jgi:hypothetical protein
MISSPPDADQLAAKKAAKKADTVSAAARELAAHERALDVHMQAVYGCSLAEYRDQMFTHGIVWGFERGEQEGRTAGRRQAKGLMTPPKKRGRPGEIDEGLRTWVIKIIEERPPGGTIEQAVTEFLTAYRLGQRLHAWEKTLDDELGRADPPLEPPDHIWCEAEAEAEAGKYCNAYYYRHLRRQTATPAMELGPFMAALRASNHK